MGTCNHPRITGKNDILFKNKKEKFLFSFKRQEIIQFSKKFFIIDPKTLEFGT